METSQETLNLKKLPQSLELKMDMDFNVKIKKNLFDPLNQGQLKGFRLVQLLVFFLAYICSMTIMDGKTLYFFPLAIALVASAEFLAYKMKYSFGKMSEIGGNRHETLIFLANLVLQALVLSIWGFHRQLELFQFIILHISFVFYMISRTGWLSQGRLGIMVWFDSLQASIILPFSHFSSSIQIWTKKSQTSKSARNEEEGLKRAFQWFLVTVSIMATTLLLVFVWSQLSQVSENFALLMEGIGDSLRNFLKFFFQNADLESRIAYVFPALPISFYLYGLMTGSLLSKKKGNFGYQDFQKAIAPLQVFPTFTVYIVIGSLCLTYALFFLAGLTELGTLLSAGTVASAISPQNASHVAVAGFWQLVRVSLLNFAVLGAFYLVAKKPLWEQRGTRLTTTILFIFASLLALLAGWKLFGIYIFLYGPTPLRLLSGWFVLVLLVWCLLTLLRLYRPIQAIRLGLFYALISFSLLCYLYPLLIK